jgi:Uma2 family endonuclease
MVTTSFPPILDQDLELDADRDVDASPLPPGCADEVPEYMELVDGELVEKTGMTAKHGLAQANLSAEWRNFSRTSGQGGRFVLEVLCRTQTQKRRPDVAYITEPLLSQYGLPSTFPQSFPLIGEIVSPDDPAEALFTKAYEYLASGCEEVWLLFPENKMALIVLPHTVLAFTEADMISTQTVLKGFSIAVRDLFA